MQYDGIRDIICSHYSSANRGTNFTSQVDRKRKAFLAGFSWVRFDHCHIIFCSLLFLSLGFPNALTGCPPCIYWTSPHVLPFVLPQGHCTIWSSGIISWVSFWGPPGIRPFHCFIGTSNGAWVREGRATSHWPLRTVLFGGPHPQHYSEAPVERGEGEGCLASTRRSDAAAALIRDWSGQTTWVEGFVWASASPCALFFCPPSASYNKSTTIVSPRSRDWGLRNFLAWGLHSDSVLSPTTRPFVLPQKYNRCPGVVGVSSMENRTGP